MSDEISCSFEDCDRPARRSGLCWGHLKQKLRGRRLRPLTERHASPTARVEEAAYELANAVENDPGALTFAQDRLRKAVDHAGRAQAREAIKSGMARAKEQGVHVGRPPSVQDHQVAELVREFGIRRASAMLGKSRGTVKRALRRVSRGEQGVGPKGNLPDPPHRA